MGRNKKHDGYKAYDYLDKDDFKRFSLAEGINPSTAYTVPLTAEQEQRMNKLLDEAIFISLHEHPTYLTKNLADVPEYTRIGRDHCAYEELSQSYYDAVFDNMLDGTTTITSKSGWKWDDILYDIGMRMCDLAHQNTLVRCEKIEDIYKAKDNGQICLIPAVEGSALIENELDRIDILYGFGVRILGVAYSEANGLGSGIKEDKDGGLTMFGRDAVRRMNQVGMAIDCSHTGYETTLEVIAFSEKPIFLTHVGAKALWNSKRLFPDEVLIACAKKGGVIGIEAAPHTTLSLDHPLHTIESFMDHFKYIVDLVGIDHVAFGPDTLYGDHVGLHDSAKTLSTGSTHGTASFERVAYVKGMENPTEASHNIMRWLIANNYSDEHIKKVLGENIIRVLKENWAH